MILDWIKVIAIVQQYKDLPANIPWNVHIDNILVAKTDVNAMPVNVRRPDIPARRRVPICGTKGASMKPGKNNKPN